MGRLIVSANMTVDCVMDPMEGWFDPTLGGGDGIAQLRAADELILGRKTYEKLAEYWPKSNPYPGAEHPACSSGGDQAELTMGCRRRDHGNAVSADLRRDNRRHTR
jgi:hypothetical protein